MDKDVKDVILGISGATVVQAGMRKFVDGMVAPMFLYTPEQYVKDLIAAGYTKQGVDAAKTDAEIGTIVMQTSGYTFASGPGGLSGANKLTATPYNYQAAAGQKVSAIWFPSTWLTGLSGAVLTTLAATNKLGSNKKHTLLLTALGTSLFGTGISRGLGVDGTITAPSGFDVSTQPGMQYLEKGAINNLNRLTAENANLRSELAVLRGSRATGTIQAGVPSVSVTELARNPNEVLRNQQFMQPGPGYQPAPPIDPHSIQFMSKLQQLDKVFL